ncbi:hypothetical protein MtrunA17_Chr1g0189061 [Medicago truncatula]|uniref:Uncharacterized protein n=1 Tax=Medicago truncatula TaxID=3880 RepID=A0A396JQG3_MEDTR|nr:hypothetical protein MtrunA17_Chr1g0189061 [Medicago truncatula]
MNFGHLMYKYSISHHLKAFTNAINESTSLFSEGYLISREECLGKEEYCGEASQPSSLFAHSFPSPSALNFLTFTPDPTKFSAKSTYDSSIALNLCFKNVTIPAPISFYRFPS